MRGRKKRELEGVENHDFDTLSKTVGNHRERRRYLAFAHIREGKSFTETARMVRVGLRTVMNWVEKFRTKGIEGIKEKHGGGVRPFIHPSENERFKNSVLDLQKTRPGGRVRGKDVIDLIEDLYGIRVGSSTVYSILKRADLVWITGRSRHPKANVKAQETFKKNL